MTREECRKSIKVISALQTLTTIDGYSEETREALDRAIEALKQTSWIPVSERPPKRGEEVIVSNHYHFWDGNELDSVETLYYAGADELGHVFQTRFGASIRNVVAWMPKPKPYKVESEE